ncbi:alpha-L-arabinofuranosidase C-terminal domain-containing protein [Plebeiibacterium sediminum]|uniref:non-reducing end alpha-L-arabinofuranosidase n=1 Tax=Plebeiibacterium sediminum TaxID=2992112 RepID=A0AAE3M6E2_9BACT|nr:alpha-L-arabinofuranosidase C-terminal domain-containing protein [Plebeiobacterium sediminum]MCW3787821.1 carbohydrate binding domain-containing protein [Plebeiobacterium sediminum]
MKHNVKITMGILLFFMATTLKIYSQPIQIDVDKPTTKIQPTMWGIFFEDINFAADGGLYAELVKNRSFEFAKPQMGWEVEKTNPDSFHFIITNRGTENPQNPRYASVKLNDNKSSLSLINEGFRGMGVKMSNTYHFSILASLTKGSDIALNVSLLDSNGEDIGSTTVDIQGEEWKKYEVSFVCSKTDPKAKLKLFFEGKGMVSFDMVSLFPNDTWKNRKGGLRADLVQKLADLNPGFFRFPGGCIVEGSDLDNRYQWKKTVGNVEDRTMIVNRWNTQFDHRPAPDYFQSFGLGFYEYFLLSEDIGAEPLPILNCGMACQFNTAEVVPVDELEPYVQDALDLIEFANGSTDTKWGKLRAEMGHPEPFNMKYIGVGNEQWGPQYFERYAIFEKAIMEKYPEISIISTTGPFPDDPFFKYAQDELQKYKAPIVDEHYYRAPQWFFDNATRYDNYDRNSYKIFAGEYAAQSVEVCSPDNTNNWQCALSEAAFMTGLERNADVVYMCSYAPLFAHVEGWQWRPDLIWFDNLNSLATPNYYVQQLFGVNSGTDLLSTKLENKDVIGQEGLFASSVWDADSKEVIIKVVNNNKEAKSTTLVLNSAKRFSSKAEMTVIGSTDLDVVNTLENPKNIVPVTKEIKVSGKQIIIDLDPYSFSVIRVKQK